MELGSNESFSIAADLIKEGYIQRTPRGRVALEKSFNFLNIDKKNLNNQTNIFRR